MRAKKLVRFVLSASVLTAMCGAAWGQTPMGTAFTYQGQLRFQNSAVSGLEDFEFRLYDSASGGLQVGPTLGVTGMQLVSGRFAVQLDFGPAAFLGDARWVEITVRPSVNGAFTTLNPRQAITAAPYALYALNGTPGPQGPVGPPGAQGAVGPAGPHGPQGAAGAQGPQGFVGPVGPAGPQGPQGAQGPAGPAGLSWQGEWVPTQTYQVDDAVSADGSSYRSLSATNLGNTPATSPASWALLARRGDQGDVGPQGAMGPIGPQGPSGAQGPAGPQGD